MKSGLPTGKNLFCHTLVAGSLILLPATSHAVRFNLGELEGSFDSDIRVGASWRVSDIDPQNVSPGNFPGGEAQSSTNDDGDLNFKRDKTYSKIIKGVHDLSLRNDRYGAFTRFKYWYDKELKDESKPHGHGPNLYEPTTTISRSKQPMISTKSLIALGVSALLANGAAAAVSEAEASRLEQDLTPVGAERAGNAAGTIPPWQGGLTEPPPGYSEGDHLEDPFADDGIIATITAANLDDYRGRSLARQIVQAVVKDSGDYQLIHFDEEAIYPPNMEGHDPEADSNILVYFKQATTAPARLTGNNLLVHDTLNQVTEPRRAWIYDLLASRYLVLGLQNESSAPIQFGMTARKANFTPAALRRSGIR